ncbi:Hexokinase-1 [Chlorella vulgaris]
MQLALPIAAAAVLLAKKLRDATDRDKRREAILDEVCSVIVAAAVAAACRRLKLDRPLQLQYRELFNTPVLRLHALRDAVVEQMEAGLAGQPGGLMMLPSFVDVLPSGHERGDCYAIDLGGTNLRVAHVRLGEDRGSTEAMHIREWCVPPEHFDTDRGTLLRFVARCTAEVVREHCPGGGGPQSRPVIGFCFSFPVEQTALDNGKVLVWTKNFRGSYLLGQDVVAALRSELAAEGLPGAVVPAVMNDTVATLVSLRYREPHTALGIILGTGTNCAYLERVAAIGKLPAGFRPRTPSMVVNTEWADLASAHLPSCTEDLWVDCSSTHPGFGLFEKQVSGLYLGEVARRILLRLAEQVDLFGSGVPGLLARHNRLDTAHLAAVDEDDSPELSGVAAVLEGVLGVRGTSRQQRQTVQEVCQLVCLRSARLCAAAIAGVLKRIGHPGGSGTAGQDVPVPCVVVAVDGSVFAKYPKYRQRLGAALADVCGQAAAASIEMQLAQDGSVLGTAGQSSKGVRAKKLLGFNAVDLSNKEAQIGVVEDVLEGEAGAQPLLVVRAQCAGQAGAGSREEHFIPYVPQIVPRVDLVAGVVYVQPPRGLLELGRQQAQLDYLRQELEPFTRPKPLSVLERMGLHTMPTSAQLVAAGRRDLSDAVKEAGGFLEVAQALGLRSQRKPAGYWEDGMNLDQELTLFVAAHWSKFKDPESHQSYWYNQITHRVSWEEPVLPQRIEIDDEGGYIMTEAEEDRVMPSRSAVHSAGRYDLHHAIMSHGGYLETGQELDRRPSWPPSQHLDSLSTLRQELRGFLSETRLAIVKRGGISATAAALGWATHRRRRHEWDDAAVVANELRQFIWNTQFPTAAQDGHATQQGKQRRAIAAGSAAQQRHKHSRTEPLPAGAKMPTHRQLAEAERLDLRYALQQHGSAKIAGMLGIETSTRGAHRRTPLREEGAPATDGNATGIAEEDSRSTSSPAGKSPLEE